MCLLSSLLLNLLAHISIKQIICFPLRQTRRLQHIVLGYICSLYAIAATFQSFCLLLMLHVRTTSSWSAEPTFSMQNIPEHCPTSLLHLPTLQLAEPANMTFTYHHLLKVKTPQIQQKPQRQHLLTLALLLLMVPLSYLLTARPRHPSSQSCQNSISHESLVFLSARTIEEVEHKQAGTGTSTRQQLLHLPHRLHLQVVVCECRPYALVAPETFCRK